MPPGQGLCPLGNRQVRGVVPGLIIRWWSRTTDVYERTFSLDAGVSGWSDSVRAMEAGEQAWTVTGSPMRRLRAPAIDFGAIRTELGTPPEFSPEALAEAAAGPAEF